MIEELRSLALILVTLRKIVNVVKLRKDRSTYYVTDGGPMDQVQLFDLQSSLLKTFQGVASFSLFGPFVDTC